MLFKASTAEVEAQVLPDFLKAMDAVAVLGSGHPGFNTRRDVDGYLFDYQTFGFLLLAVPIILRVILG